MILFGLISLILCEVSFLDIKSPDNRKVVTGSKSLRLEDINNNTNTFFRFKKKTGVGSRKKGELYKEDKNGKRQYMCLMSSDNEVNLDEGKHFIFITKIKDKFRISDKENRCLTIQGNNLTSEKCDRNKSQLFNITFYKHKPEDKETNEDVHIDKTRSEKSGRSATEYKDDIDIFVNKDDKETGDKDVVWVEKPKKEVTPEENEQFQVLKPAKYKEKQNTSVVIRPGVIEEKQIADIIEKTISTTISTTITQTVKKMEIVTEYLPVESTTTISVPAEQVLPPININNNLSKDNQIKPNVQIRRPLVTKRTTPASLYEDQSVESDTESDDKANRSIMRSSVLPRISKIKPTDRRRKRPITKDLPSESSESISSCSSDTNSSEERLFKEKLQDIIKEKHKGGKVMKPITQRKPPISQNPRSKSFPERKDKSITPKTSYNKTMKPPVKSKDIKDTDSKDTDKMSKGMTQEEYDVDLATSLFDKVFESTLDHDSDVFRGYGLGGLEEELTGTDLEEIIGDKSKRKNKIPHRPEHENRHKPSQHPIEPQKIPHRHAMNNVNQVVYRPVPVHREIVPIQNERQESKPVVPVNQPIPQNQVVREQIVITQPIRKSRPVPQAPNEQYNEIYKAQGTPRSKVGSELGNLDEVEEDFLSSK